MAQADPTAAVRACLTSVVSANAAQVGELTVSGTCDAIAVAGPLTLLGHPARATATFAAGRRLTTHSPLVYQAADAGGIYHLPEPGSSEGPRRLTTEECGAVVASRPNRILTGPAFGLPSVRSPDAIAKRTDFSRLASKRRAGAVLSGEEQRRFVQLGLFNRHDADDIDTEP